MVFTNGSVCSAINCTNNRKKTPHLSFFRCPKDPERCRKWQVNCGREDLLLKDADYLHRNIKFCSLHFEQNQFMNELRNKLVWNAVPTLFDIPSKPSHVALLKRKLQTFHSELSTVKKRCRRKTVTNLRETSDSAAQWCYEYKMLQGVECKVEIAEEDMASGVASRPQMFEVVECKGLPSEDDGGCDVGRGPQTVGPVKPKVEPPEENPEADMADELQMFEAVEMKMEPPEDATGSDAVHEPQVFEFVAVKTEPCKGSPEGSDVDTLELQASAAADEGADSRRCQWRRFKASSGTGGGAARPPASSRKSKATIPRQARKIILNVAECCEVEKKTKQLLYPLSEPLKRAAEYVGRSVENLAEVCRSGDCAGPTPGKKRKMNDEKLEDVDERVIRETIEEFYTVQKTVPTLGKLASALREKTGCEWRSTATLRKTLKALGFVWRKVDEEDSRTFLLERFGLVRRRSRFIVGMRYWREVGREIFYLDESWLDTNLKSGNCRDEGGTFGPVSGSAAARLVIRSVGSRKGFLEGARQSFRTVPSKKWTSATDFEKWFEASVLPNLPPASVIVMDDAPHRCRQADPAPSAYDPKVHMVAWLRRRGVDCDDSMMKYVLWELIRANGGSRKDYVVDQMASVRGHSVIRLPPNVRDLNAGELVWAQIVERVRLRAAPPMLAFANLQKIVAAACRSVTDAEWEGYCDRVRAIEEDYWRRDGVVEDAVDDVIRNPDAPDTSDDSEGSITEDSETESD